MSARTAKEGPSNPVSSSPSFACLTCYTITFTIAPSQPRQHDLGVLVVLARAYGPVPLPVSDTGPDRLPSVA
jgi:hypothetical protein